MHALGKALKYPVYGAVAFGTPNKQEDIWWQIRYQTTTRREVSDREGTEWS